MNILLAFVLIVSFSCNSIGRTSEDTLSTCSFRVIEAISVGILIGSFSRFDGYPCDYRTTTNCFPERGYQTIAQSKGAEACGICCVTFRPCWCKPTACWHHLFPKRRKQGCTCFDTFIVEGFYKMKTKLHVIFFTIFSWPCPPFWRKAVFFSLVQPGLFGLRKNPAYNC